MSIRRGRDPATGSTPLNYLAHLTFAEATAPSVVGNVGADFVRGRHAFNRLPVDVQEGVLLHRFVDDATDCHPRVRDARLLLYPKWRHLGRVFTDLFFDHFLARDWDTYHGRSLRDFLDSRYELMTEGADYLGHRWFSEFVHGVRKHDRFFQYQYVEDMENVLSRLANRVTPGRFPPVSEAMGCFLEHYDALDAVFSDFYPDLVDAVRGQNTAQKRRPGAC